MTLLRTAPFNGDTPMPRLNPIDLTEVPVTPCWVKCPTPYTCDTYGCQKESREKQRLGPCQAHDRETEKAESKDNPFSRQVGGDHYKSFAIQPTEFITSNGLDFCTGNVIKYVVRKKGDKAKRLEDLNKAKHYIDILIAMETK